MEKIECFIDGACEPRNPGGMGSYGVYAVKAGIVVIEDFGVLHDGPEMTNNVAEYSALLKALSKIKEKFGIDSGVVIYTDSQLVANQMNDVWPIRSGIYATHAYAAMEYAKQFTKIKYVWIPREKNSFADALSKRALAEIGIKPHPSRR